MDPPLAEGIRNRDRLFIAKMKNNRICILLFCILSLDPELVEGYSVTMKSPLQILILAGGVGTRLWPMSRQKLPKQFQPLVGNQTLFQLALARAKKLTKAQHIFVATNQEFTKLVKQQAKEIPSKNIISEPAFRDTATCLGFSAAVLESRNPGGVFAVVYADNLIREEKEFTRKVRAAAEIANTGKISIIEV